MKRTTIFLSDEMHDRLRRDAFQAKVSMAEYIRIRLREPRPRKNRGEDPIMKVAGSCSGPIMSRDIDESLYGG
jgi:hypothetical protein